MSEQKTEFQLLAEISSKLDRVIGLLAISGRDQNDQIRILKGLGFEWGEIGTMVGLKGDAARKRLNSFNDSSRRSADARRLRKGDL
jgi:hypothetical protein